MGTGSFTGVLLERAEMHHPLIIVCVFTKAILSDYRSASHMVSARILCVFKKSKPV